MIFKNKKTGKLYLKLFSGIDCTNSRDGEKNIVYTNFRKIFTREKKEFNAKFKKIL